MGFFSKSITTLDDLFVHTLQDIYYAEHQITKALPKMIDKTTEPALKDAFLAHLGETKNQITRLEQVFGLIGQEPKGVTCQAIDGIIDEAQHVIGDVEVGDVLDAAMLSSAQAVEHYEISRYGTMIAFARQLGREDAARVLQQTLDEEKSTDQKLTKLAESRINQRASV